MRFEGTPATLVAKALFEYPEPSQRLVMSSYEFSRKIGVIESDLKKAKRVWTAEGVWSKEVKTKDGLQYHTGNWELE